MYLRSLSNLPVMKSVITKNRSGWFPLVGKLLLYVVPIVGLLGILLPLLLEQYNLFLLGTYIAIPMISTPLIYLTYYRNASENIAFGDRLFKALLAAFCLAYLISLIILAGVSIRPYIYYLIIALAATIVLLEIMLFDLSGNRVWIIMAQVMALSLNLIWGVNLKYHFYLGRTDILLHSGYVNSLLNIGYVTNAFGTYRPFPLWHIMTGYLHTLTGVTIEPYKMMFFANGLVYIFMLACAYMILLKIFKDTRIALISSLFMAVCPFFLLMGMSSIPRDVIPIFLLVILLLSLDKYSKGKFILASFLTLTIIVYHTVSILFILIILLMIVLTRVIFVRDREKSILDVKFFALAIAMFLAYWAMFADVLVAQIMSNLFGAAPTGVITKAIIGIPLSELANYAQYSLLLFFVIAGIILILKSSKLNNTVKVFCIVALILMPLMFPGPTLLLNKLSHNFNIDRFSESGLFFIALTAGYGFWEMFNRSKKLMKATLIVLFAILVLLSVSNDFTASDNPLVKRPFYTYYLTEGEVNGIGNIYEKTEGLVMSDYITVRYMTGTPYKNKAHIIEIDDKSMAIYRNNSSDILLIRDGEFDKRPLKLHTNDGGVFVPDPDWILNYYYKDAAIEDSLGTLNRVYDSNDIYGLN